MTDTPPTISPQTTTPLSLRPGDTRTLGQSILHASHDEANHQGEMYLLMKMQWLNLNT